MKKWALKIKKVPTEKNGFTIVELLIVIIVIGILAALVLVAYSNVGDQAKASAAKNDLEQVAKQLNVYKENTGGGSAYPADASSLTYSSGTTLQYAVNNSASPATYCVTAINGGTAYYVTNTSSVPTAGYCSTSGAGTAGWWKFNNDLTDSSGNGRTLIPTGTVAPAVGQNGSANTAYNLAGSTSSFFDTGYTYPAQTFTASMWVYPDGTGPNSFATLMSSTRDCCSTYSGFQIHYQVTTPYKLTGLLWNGGGGPAAAIDSSPGLTLNAWNYVVLTYDGSTLNLYRNGANVGSSSITTSIPTPTANVFIGRMGAISSGYSFGGRMDDVRMYNRALLPAEISALYSAGAQ